MKRCLVVGAFLFVVMLADAHAYYVKIVFKLGAKSQNGETPGMPGALPGGIMPGGDERVAGKGGVGGLERPGGLPGGPGMPGPGGIFPPMSRGMRGGYGMLGMGMRGGYGMMGMRGGYGMTGMGGAYGGMYGGWPGTQTSNVEDDIDITTIRAEVVVEVQSHRNVPLRPQFTEITHKWGKTALRETDDIKVHVYDLEKVAKRYKRQHDDAYKKEKKNLGDLLHLADWALEHGLLDDFAKVMSDVVKLNPSQPAADAFSQVEEQLRRPITKSDKSAFWREKLGNYKDEASKHYVLLYTARLSEPATVKSYLDRLEGNYRAFFYWFARKGIVLPAPEERLVAVLVDRPEEFEQQHKAFDPAPLVADGFFARRDNLAIFSAERLDQPYEVLKQGSKDLWTSGWDRQALLKGKGARRNLTDTDDDVSKAQMIALMLTAMAQESELAAVSHEGTRQLAAATGLLPRTVNVPQWAQFGLASFFETPKGAFWPGTGAPNRKYYERYKFWKNNKKLDKADEALKSVVADRYFRLAAAATGEQAEAHLLKARTMSWALTYFLAHKRLDGLLRYYKELAKLPRDLAFDEDALLGCFARAFDLVDANKPNEINEVKLRALAFDWDNEISNTRDEVPQATKDDLAELEAAAKKKPSDNSSPPGPGTVPPNRGGYPGYPRGYPGGDDRGNRRGGSPNGS